MVNEDIVLRKLKKLEESVKELLQAKDISWEKYNLPSIYS